jgi:hypothetical protein
VEGGSGKKRGVDNGSRREGRVEIKVKRKWLEVGVQEGVVEGRGIKRKASRMKR